jgi:cobalamin biosynthesis Mg chelatase CobN
MATLAAVAVPSETKPAAVVVPPAISREPSGKKGKFRSSEKEARAAKAAKKTAKKAARQADRKARAKANNRPPARPTSTAKPRVEAMPDSRNGAGTASRKAAKTDTKSTSSAGEDPPRSTKKTPSGAPRAGGVRAMSTTMWVLIAAIIVIALLGWFFATRH